MARIEEIKINWADEPVNSTRIYEHYFLNDSTSNIEGEYRRFYKNGNMEMKVWYENGKKDGKCIQYFPNGKIKSITYYKNGLRHGKYIFYDEKGNIELELMYKKGIRQ